MLIPTVIALSSFFASNFPAIDWYPYWYLGNPFYYLIGPAVPTTLWLVKFIGLPMYAAYLFIIGASFFIGAAGLYLFLGRFNVRRSNAFFASIAYVALPFGLFLLNYQDGLHHIAFNFLPITLFFYFRFLQDNSTRNALFFAAFVAILLLISISILLSLIVGCASLFIAIRIKSNTSQRIMQTVLAFFLAISIATFWYTPGFWWTILANPSFGGVPLANLIMSLGKFILHFLPLVLAIIIVKWRRYILVEGSLLFGALFFASFFFLTVVRFLSDPDFIIDWIGFGLELQFGMAVVVGSVLELLVKRKKAGVFLVGLFTIVILLDCYIISNLVIQQFNIDSLYQQKILKILRDNVPKGERVFLSGTPVFWVNAYINQPQIRGGIDSASIHPFWRHAAFQIREGKDPSLTRDLLISLGTPYVLVHRDNSKETFRDFKTPTKFDSSYFTKIVGLDDVLYKTKANEFDIARIAKAQIIHAAKPKKGDDVHAIHEYISNFIKPISATFIEPYRLIITGNPDKQEVISIAVSYHPSWKITAGNGTLTKDSFGNIVIIPQDTGQQQFVLSFYRNGWDFFIVMIASLVFCLMLLYDKTISAFFQKYILPMLSLGLSEDD